MVNKKQIVLCIIIAAINILADRLTKVVAIIWLKGKEPIKLIRETIIIVYTENTGAFLSLGSNWPLFRKNTVLLYIPLLICISIFIYCLIKPINKVKTILLITIVSGGIGNLIDRLLNNFAVIDFMNFGIGKIRTGILNVADLSITVGVIFIVVYEVIEEKRKVNNAE